MILVQGQIDSSFDLEYVLNILFSTSSPHFKNRIKVNNSKISRSGYTLVTPRPFKTGFILFKVHSEKQNKTKHSY